MQLEWGARIRVGCLQWCQLILRSPASPRSQLPYGGCGAGGFFVAIVRETACGQGVCTMPATLPGEYQMYYDL
nr:MAG TPA: hypothetical protein [Caudoviricetes sp.]